MPRPKSSESPAIVWFRDDLRLADNRALHAAVENGGPIVALYVHDEASDGIRRLGGASRWWLHHALEALDAGLRARGGSLTILEGPAFDVVTAFAQEIGARLVTWSRRYGKSEREIDARVKTALCERGIAVESFNDHLIAEPWEVRTQAGASFRVFSPFYRALTQAILPPPPLPVPERLQSMALPSSIAARPLASLRLLPRIKWDAGLGQTWTPGEDGAQRLLTTFVRSNLRGYADGRDRIDLAHTSRLSPHLRFGEISPRQVWHAVEASRGEAPEASQADRNKVLSELGWREFSYHLLFHNPDLATQNFARRFDGFPWRDDARALRAWQQGATGVPIVDAGMRELWHTGYMHNRVRMIAASYLIKHLMIDWRAGERWFWDTLVDADPANNPASWQWVAGSGADAAPYFRVFNPVLQAAKFDPEGAYIRRWVPELAKLPAPHLFKPWEAPAMVLSAAGVAIGKTYPAPLVDLDVGRERALSAFAKLPKS